MVSLKEYLAKGQTTISNLLLENYHHLGLTNDEFCYGCSCIGVMSKEMIFPIYVRLPL